MDSTAFISVSNLTKTYNFGRVRALNDVSLDIKAGEIFGLIGPNGAGKTTLMGCLLGLLWPSKGSVTIDGLAPNDLKVKRMTGFMPERPSFDKWMTISQFLTYQYMLAGLPMDKRKATINDALEAVQLDKSAWKRPVRKLSRGMLQRVGLAQILIGKPRLCLLDEPTSGMDPLGMALVRNLLLRWKSEGATIVLNSHHLHEVERICDRVAFIQTGKIESIESMREPLAGSVFNVRWDEVPADINQAAALEQLTSELGIVTRDAETGGTKIILSDPKQAADVVRFLVTKGVPVTEAAFERKTLLDLFVASEGEK